MLVGPISVAPSGNARHEHGADIPESLNAPPISLLQFLSASVASPSTPPAASAPVRHRPSGRCSRPSLLRYNLLPGFEPGLAQPLPGKGKARRVFVCTLRAISHN